MHTIYMLRAYIYLCVWYKQDNYVKMVKKKIKWRENVPRNAGPAMEKWESCYADGWDVNCQQPLRRTVWRFLRKLKIELPYDPAIPLLGIYPEITIIQKGACTTMFIAALFTIIRTWKQLKCPSTDEWIKKMWHIYTMEYYSAIKKKRN